MTKHTVATQEQWLVARRELLEAEKELTRRSDALAQARRELPWVRVDKDYRFETEAGQAREGETIALRPSERLIIDRDSGSIQKTRIDVSDAQA